MTGRASGVETVTSPGISDLSQEKAFFSSELSVSSACLCREEADPDAVCVNSTAKGSRPACLTPSFCIETAQNDGAPVNISAFLFSPCCENDGVEVVTDLSLDTIK